VATMGRRARPPVTHDDPSNGAPRDPRPPSMFRRPTDAPDALLPIRGSEPLSIVHTKWARMHTPAEDPAARGWQRILRRSRGVAARVIGRGDHELLGDLIRAVDAVATRCDELTVRVETLTTNVDDIARTYGEDLTQIRADLEQLRKDRSDEGPGAAPRDG
jgi:hypothetical protein